jgi:hypothetical protein
VLTNHYLDAISDIEFMWRYGGQSGSYEMRVGPFGARRLDTLAEVLGDEAFDRAVASTREEFDKQCKDIEARLAKPCVNCGRTRNFDDLLRPVREYQDDDLCRNSCGG